MVERNNWKEQVKKLNSEINNIIDSIPQAYWDDDEGFAIGPHDREWGEAIDAASESLPSPAEAIRVLEDRKSNSYYDILKAELTIALIKKLRLEQANMSPQELKERSEKSEGRGWFVPGFLE